jgi:hypothetical protein
MANNPQNPQNEQQKAQKSEQGRFADQKSEQRPGQGSDRERTPQERERYAQQNAGRDDSMVGKDTDGDGKVVKPGQKPGQSHGQGLPENKKQ